MKAIILSAGMGTRLLPLTLKFPKSLLSINGKTLFESNIEFFKNNGIDDITVVTGHMNESFDPYIKKYGIKKVVSDVYEIKNSSSSLNLVRENLDDTIVIDGDIFIVENVFPYLKNGVSQMFAKEIVKGSEDGYITDENDKVIKVIKGATSGYGFTGMIYLAKDLAEALTRDLPNAPDNYFWEYVVYDLIKEHDLYLTKIPNIIYEIDSVADILFYKLMNKEQIIKLANEDSNAIEALNAIFSKY